VPPLWLLAIQFPNRPQASLYAIEGGNTEKLMAKLTAARDSWAKMSGAVPMITVFYEVGQLFLLNSNAQWRGPSEGIGHGFESIWNLLRIESLDEGE